MSITTNLDRCFLELSPLLFQVTWMLNKVAESDYYVKRSLAKKKPFLELTAALLFPSWLLKRLWSAITLTEICQLCYELTCKRKTFFSVGCWTRLRSPITLTEIYYIISSFEKKKITMRCWLRLDIDMLQIGLFQMALFSSLGFTFLHFPTRKWTNNRSAKVWNSCWLPIFTISNIHYYEGHPRPPSILLARRCMFVEYLQLMTGTLSLR